MQVSGYHPADNKVPYYFNIASINYFYDLIEKTYDPDTTGIYRGA